MKNFSYWLPRILAILYIVFISSFALDVFDGSQWFLPLIIHLIPPFILLAITIIAWKHEFIGGFIFIISGFVLLIILHSEIMIISVPSIILGILFLNGKSFSQSFIDKRQLDDFLDNFKIKKIILTYKGDRMNAACDWPGIRKNPWGMIFRSILGEVFKKMPPCNFKNSIYRIMGFNIGKDVVIAPNVFLDPLFPELITIEDGVILGWGCRLLAHEFTIDKIQLGRIIIKEKSLIGMFSTVRSGVIVGERAIISMCSLINKDIDADSFVGGIPARKIGNN